MSRKRTLSKKRKWIKKIYLPLSIILILALVLFFNINSISNFFFGGGQSSRGELLKVILTFIAGIIAILVWRNGIDRVRIMEEGNLETRFNNAVGYFGSNDPALVLGGIHAMHQIAIRHRNYQRVVHDLFCGYLQEKSAELYKDIDENSGRCPAIIQTLIKYLFSPDEDTKEIVYSGIQSDLSFSTLRNVNFNMANLTNCWFDRATLTNCKFIDTILKDCKFYGDTKLMNCEFYDGTTLVDCMFWRRTKLTNCKFWRKAQDSKRLSVEGAKLTSCKFYSGTTLTGCNFIKTTLTSCDFSATNLDEITEKASLDEFTKNSFYDANLDDFTEESLNRAIITDPQKTGKT